MTLLHEPVQTLGSLAPYSSGKGHTQGTGPSYIKKFGGLPLYWNHRFDPPPSYSGTARLGCLGRGFYKWGTDTPPHTSMSSKG